MSGVDVDHDITFLCVMGGGKHRSRSIGGEHALVELEKIVLQVEVADRIGAATDDCPAALLGENKSASVEPRTDWDDRATAAGRRLVQRR
jgi:hypothetical protein